MACPNIVEKTFAGGSKTAKFMSVISLESFASLRPGEMTVPRDDSYDPSVHLDISNISVDDLKNLSITIKQSKTDPFHRVVRFQLC